MAQSLHIKRDRPPTGRKEPLQIITIRPMLSLQVFADGAAAAGDGAAQGTGVTGEAAAPRKGAKGNSLANVIYGKQEDSAPAAEVQTEPQKAEEAKPADLDAEFEDLIKGKYKNQFQNRTQNIIRQRLKGNEDTVENFKAISPVLELLAKKYNVPKNDVKALASAIEADDDLYEQEALEEGITPKELRKRISLQRQNQDLMKQLNQRKEQDFARQQIAEWEKQAAKAKLTYPNLDLDVESQNPKFQQLLKSGIDVETAYTVLHRDDILAGAMQHAVKTAEQKLTNKIIANNARPSENGMASQSAAVIKNDPSQFTRADRKEILRRVAAGEKIRL